MEFQSFFFGRSGKAVGLSAISLLAPLAKDAAPIPNALVAIKTKKISEFQNPIKFHKSSLLYEVFS